MLKYVKPAKFTIAVLLYGDYPDLAKRCLEPISQINEPFELILGLNAVSEESAKYAKSFKAKIFDHPENACKYPVLREMLKTINTEYLMWFDDDSYIKEPSGWLSRVDAAMQDTDMLGWIYKGWLKGKQKSWVKRQPWYTFKEITEPVDFVHGSWWTARTEMLQKLDWPWVDVLHRGGDIALGLCMHQQSLRMKDFQEDVVFNMAARRGFDEQPIGFLG